MQTNKIKVDQVYAIRRHEQGETRKTLFRFKVLSKATVENSNGTHTTLTGYIIEDQKPGEDRVKVEYKPQDILGPFKDFEETANREQEEREQRKAQDKADEEAATTLVQKFYAITETPMPNDMEAFGNYPFKVTSYPDGRVEIDPKGVLLLLAALKKKGL